ncbi:hypothetical protein NPIL_187041 [Nephila pilipes]|uniref:Uncharacterized protein n=1 Tax=Nephila pilipes TaxID=299642 RepID=A0A8X6QN85_NEPPI|nr:hypothetical protein NPIL_187041 [Nephila pilipes]
MEAAVAVLNFRSRNDCEHQISFVALEFRRGAGLISWLDINFLLQKAFNFMKGSFDWMYFLQSPTGFAGWMAVLITQP